MLHGTRVVRAAISLEVFDARARVQLVGCTRCSYCGLSRSGVAFGLVALTALRRVFTACFSASAATEWLQKFVYISLCTNAAPLRASLYSCVSHCCLSQDACAELEQPAVGFWRVELFTRSGRRGRL